MLPAGPPVRHSIEIALLVTLATLWGASYTFIKIGVATIPPVTLIAGRTLIAGVILLAAMRLRGLVLPRDKASWQRFAVQACLNSVVPFTLIAWAELTVDAGLAAILNSTTPIFAFLFTWGFTRHEPVSGLKLVGIGAGLLGVTLIVGAEALTGFGRNLPGQLAIIVATIAYAAAAIYGRGFTGLDPTVPAAGSLICGACILIPISFAVDRPWALSPSLGSLGALLALAVFSTALAFTIYFRLIHTLGSIGTTAQGYLRVPIGVAIGMIFLGESLSPTAWAGFAGVVLGVAAMTIPTRPQAPRLRAR